ncbi:uncharacterized protein LOC118457836 [Anopheles albimanus]|uniref:uncharacterized protein LOC118457836 n=1 Tax=Anopheles albimanus TaxID=7167 RepID=UPI00163E9B96|nr:uncharacterized protein LOC118457836 [Anopheles albimanus]
MLFSNKMNTFLSLVVVVLPAALALQVIFESVESDEGLGLFETELRVRKYNRTITVVNGTFSWNAALDDSIVVSMELFHSPLGNQQFNYYPMKIPTSGVCQFMKTIYDEYSEYLYNIVNMPPRDECPILPRKALILDKFFPSKAVPQMVPAGLWKAHVFVKDNEVLVGCFTVVVKAYNDNYF